MENMKADLGDSAPFTLRRAVLGDASNLLSVYLAARRASQPAIPPLVHLDEDVDRWFRYLVIPSRETWLAEKEGHTVAVMVLDGNDLDQLYVHPECQSCGVGSALVRLAQSLRPDGLFLWTFQSNVGAQRFYERHGFVAAYRTDGTDNEEQAPDIRYEWHPPDNA